MCDLEKLCASMHVYMCVNYCTFYFAPFIFRVSPLINDEDVIFQTGEYVAEWVRIVRIKVIQLLVLCYLIFIYHRCTFTYFTMHASSDKPTFDIRPLYFYWPTTLAGN